MTQTTIRTAEHYNILDRLQNLEKDLLAIEDTAEVDFDVRDFDELSQVILLVKYNIPISDEHYYSRRKKNLVSILLTCFKHGLLRTDDRIEDYGEHWYIVRDSNSDWR